MTIQISYKDNILPTATEMAYVFKDSGLKRPVDDLVRIQKMIEHADLIVTAWDNDTLVGVARCVTDFSYCCYLSDLAVLSKYQKLGIGKRLIESVQSTIGEQVALILLSAPDAMNYYPHIGFNEIKNGFIIPRKN